MKFQTVRYNCPILIMVTFTYMIYDMFQDQDDDQEEGFFLKDRKEKERAPQKYQSWDELVSHLQNIHHQMKLSIIWTERYKCAILIMVTFSYMIYD